MDLKRGDTEETEINPPMNSIVQEAIFKAKAISEYFVLFERPLAQRPAHQMAGDSIF